MVAALQVGGLLGLYTKYYSSLDETAIHGSVEDGEEKEIVGAWRETRGVYRR